MINSKVIGSGLTAVITGVFLLLSGCGGGSSSSDGGGGTVSFPPPATSPPTGATTFTALNAEDEASAAYGMIQDLINLNDWVGAADVATISIGDIARIVKTMAQKLNAIDGVAGAEWEYICLNSAIVTGNDTIDVGDDNEGRFRGSMSFNGCDDGWGFPIEGTVVYDYSWFANGNYSDHFGGDLNITISSISIEMAGMDYTDSGNDSGNYSLTVTFAVSASVGGGYLMQTPTPIAGHRFDGECAQSGEALATGDADTQLKLTFGGGTAFAVQWSDGNSFSSPLPNNGGVFNCLSAT